MEPAGGEVMVLAVVGTVVEGVWALEGVVEMVRAKDAAAL